MAEMRLTNPEIMTFNTVRIAYPDAHFQENGGGTGFFFHYMLSKNIGMEFIVTNKHVYQASQRGRLYFHQKIGESSALNITPPKSYDIDNWQSLWFGHPSDDVDIATLSCVDLYERENKRRPDLNIQFSDIVHDINYSFIASHLCYERSVPINVIEEIYFAGYPNLLWDKYHAMPIVRRGINATRIDVDFQNKPCFLIDASVFPGSSGSPVFILNEGFYHNGNATVLGGSRCVFLGVLSSVYQYQQLWDLITVPVAQGENVIPMFNEKMDLGYVIKAQTVIETIETWCKYNSINLIELKEQARRIEAESLLHT